ncbi:uncharacterized protein LY89DRAFT_777916 [Mollisia scopiformis]|uniref:Uncharacterized protein n=1 Tax=Mollisia scopiformis TaxID=149040 RepID=A0A194XT73_MOLSC|nr:uncharacterized protein LY89DRAFT_777916 [Mollisia scopiformis]KUJ22897.1 hypothetical protein LY89DRAFT_777916 [Mollisia scopiformis]
MFAEVQRMAPSYSDYVFAQSKRNPCLINLCQFIANDDARYGCRIASLQFRSDCKKPTRVDLGLQELEAIICSDVHGSGRLIIVEDLNGAVIETLGSGLDINPLFFASHIHGPKVEITSSKPSAAILPSKMLSQNFLSLQYQRSVDFGPCTMVPKKMSRDCNVPRKVVILPPMKDTRIGLEQQSCSILMSTTRSNSWLGVILVDKPNSDKYTSPEKKMVLPSRPFQGGYEDFSKRPSLFDDDRGYPERSSLLEDLIYFWTKELPPAFDNEQPTLLSLSYYPLKIAAAEWVSYISVMSNSIKQFEYTTEAPSQKDGLQKIDSDLRSLETWGRRCLQTSSKLQAALDFLKHHTKDNSGLEQYSMMIQDFEHIMGLVYTYGHRLEIMVPVVTSVLQIADTRRSLREAANVTRLTNLALLFVPLSFVASLFSMNGSITRHGLAIYFAIAIPLCAVVFFVARLPVIDFASISLAFRYKERREARMKSRG